MVAGRGEIGALDVVDVEAGVVGGEMAADEAFGVKFFDDLAIALFVGADVDGDGREFAHSTAS